MPKYRTQEETFLKCKKEGKFIFFEENKIKEIISTIEIAEADIKSADILKKEISHKSMQWVSIYKLYYDAIHELTEAFLKFEKIKIDNHQCLFAYLCEKHPELDLDWDFFEKIRTKRNGINYYGQQTTYEDFKDVELQFNLYAKKLISEIRKRIKNN